ncbi:hypothetical protein [Enterococcus dongliensis]|uniref:hypothetical protein n=1 Tax=Enterococcus dongliensis TaxID=2559925 RepID=UPI00288E8A4D|nr:hypothetical protein [Enterococcus dongliensis]MDT2613829.1 hypothetical protein [Enterococcus dongliensis]
MQKDYLIDWQVFDHTSYVETVRAASESAAKRKIIRACSNASEYEGREVKFISVKQVD